MLAVAAPQASRKVDMRITGYRTLTTSHDWGRPVGDVNGVFRDGVVEVGLLLLETDEGITGVSTGLVSEIARVFPAIEGEDPRATSALYDRMLRYVFKSGHGGSVFGAIGALDTALWDIKAKAAGQPLWRLLGGRDRVVPAYASGLDIALTDDELCLLYQSYADRGLQAAKLKGGLSVETDRTRLTLVRDLLTSVHGGRVPSLMLDANECWTRKQAVRHVAALEQTLDLTWVEEPVRRWDAEGMAMVGRSVRASIATGENLTGLESFRPLLAAGAVDVVQTASVWGVTHFLRVATLAHAHDLPVSGIGTTPIGLLHAATSLPNHMATELQDLTPPVGITVDMSVEDGAFVLGDAPGLGLSVDEAAIVAVRRPDGMPSPHGSQVRPGNAGVRLDVHALR
jgi:L-alanine-DL-glutamate epimerase-like enolase superfamily enzyme